MVTPSSLNLCSIVQSCHNCCKVTAYGCVYFDFFINMRCALLPQKVRYEKHDHPLDLVCNPFEIDDQGLEQDMCELCEGLREPLHWYYSCEECDHCLHVNVFVQKSPSMPFSQIPDVFNLLVILLLTSDIVALVSTWFWAVTYCSGTIYSIYFCITIDLRKKNDKETDEVLSVRLTFAFQSLMHPLRNNKEKYRK